MKKSFLIHRIFRVCSKLHNVVFTQIVYTFDTLIDRVSEDEHWNDRGNACTCFSFMMMMKSSVIVITVTLVLLDYCNCL